MVRKILVSIFDGVSNGGALREICDLAGGFTGENLRENAGKKAVGAASVIAGNKYLNIFMLVTFI